MSHLDSARAYMASLPSGQRRRSVVTRWFAALDNYTPVREHAVGHAVSFTLPTTGETAYILFGIEKLAIPSESVYVIDDGAAVTAMYPVVWHGTGNDEYGPRVVVHPYPVGQSMTAWSLGPKRSYHVKLSVIK